MTSINQGPVADITGASSGIGAAIAAEDVAEVIAFAVSRPRRLAIHDVLLRPAGWEL